MPLVSASMHGFNNKPLVSHMQSNVVMQRTQAGGTPSALKLRQIGSDVRIFVGVAGDHAKHFVLERYWAAGMLPLFPAAFFIHHPIMDYAVAIAVGMHIHWFC